MNGTYYGNWFQKYVSFLKDDSVYSKRKSFFALFVFSVSSVLYYLLKLLIIKLKDKRHNCSDKYI